MILTMPLLRPSGVLPDSFYDMAKVPSLSRNMTMRLDNLCSSLRTTTDMECFPIEELIIRKEEGGVHREFLLILLSRPSGEKSWVRLERKRPVGALGTLAADISAALIENLILP